MARRKRKARIVIPAILATIPSGIYSPGAPPGDLDDPHNYQSETLISYRPNLRSHHRIILLPQERRERYLTRTVEIEQTRRDFDPFRTTWQPFMDGYRITHHFRPEAKNDRDLNRRQRDWKHRDRNTPDDSRADALRALPYRWRKYRDYMGGALATEDPRIVADTAIVLNSVIRRTLS